MSRTQSQTKLGLAIWFSALALALAFGVQKASAAARLKFLGQLRGNDG